MRLEQLAFIAVIAFSSVTESAQAARPHQVCPAVMGGFFRYQKHQQAEAETRNTIKDLETFAEAFDEVVSGPIVPSFENISVRGSNADVPQVMKVLNQIAGIEKSWSTPITEDASVNAIVAGIRFGSLREIESFYKYVRDIFMMATGEKIESPNNIFSYVAATLEILGGARDGQYESALRNYRSLQNSAKPNDWIYDSSSYLISKSLINRISQAGYEMSEDAVLFENPKSSVEKGWVGIDRLIRLDSEGNAAMWFVLRTQSKRPFTKAHKKEVTETITVITPETRRQTQWAPVPVYTPR